MKLLYISSPSFADCDFPLIKKFIEKGLDVTFLIILTPYELRSTLIDIKNIYTSTGVFPASIYPEIAQFEKYLDISKIFVCNRTGKSRLSCSYWLDTLNFYSFIYRGKFDLIHTNLFFSGDKKYIYKLGKFITTIHDPFPHSGEDWNYSGSKYDIAINNSTGLVLLNEQQKSRFCQTYNVNNAKILVNKLGVYDVISNFFDKSPNPKVSNNILFFGRVAPYKGIEYLCEAMKMVRKKIPDATLTIAGNGKPYFDIIPYKKLGFIEFRNYYVGINELADLLQQASLTVCPYTDATQSGVIMTSYSMLKPVVATNVGGLSEMIVNGETGLLVPPRDSKKLAEAIISLLSDKNKLNEMSYNIARTYSFGSNSWDSIADKYIQFYKKILVKAN